MHTIQEAFQDAAEKGEPLINKSQFDRGIVSLVSGEDLRQEEKILSLRYLVYFLHMLVQKLN